MSHTLNLGDKLRAAIAVAAVWALMFSMSVSGAAAANATDVVFNNDHPAGVGLFACFKRHMTQRGDVGSEKAPGSNNAGKHHCPCCLAAAAAAAVLPERIAAAADRLRVARPVSYFAATGNAPKSAPCRSANGARAPPALI
jgi:hypothetical protein